jgi:hypothetical protein
VPSGIEGLDGATVIDTNVAGVTVRMVVPLIFPTQALTAVLPVAAVCANPVTSTVATVVAVEAQVAVLVSTWVVESVYVPVAVSC